MVSLNDVNMDGVKPAGEYQELPEGQYLVRIEETEKKPTKDRFDEHGAPSPDNGKNFYLQVSLKVYGGPNDGHVEFDRLNLWNGNSIAVNIAKSQLKSIFMAVGVESSDSSALHGKWMVLEVKKQRNGQLGKYYSTAPAEMVPTNVTPVEIPAARPAVATVAAAAASPNALPSWAARK